MERYIIFNILSLLCLIVGLILTIVGSYYTDYYYVWYFNDSTSYIVCIVIGCILLILAIIFASIARQMRRRMFYGHARPAMVQVQYAQSPMAYTTPGSNVAAYPGPPPTYQYNNFSTSNGYPQQQYPPQSAYPPQQAQPSYATDFKS